MVQIIETLKISENYLNFKLLKDNILAMTSKKQKNYNKQHQLNKTSVISYYFIGILLILNMVNTISHQVRKDNK